MKYKKKTFKVKHKQYETVTEVTMFEAHGQPTVKFKSITTLNIRTIIYTKIRPCCSSIYKNKVWSFLSHWF